MRVITAFLLLQSMVLGQDFNLFDWVKPAPVKQSLTVEKLVKPYSPPIATLSYKQIQRQLAVYGGHQYSAPVCNSPRCKMCAIIRSQLAQQVYVPEYQIVQPAPSLLQVTELVPTPSHLIPDMVALANIGTSDVVYEPGCGNADILKESSRYTNNCIGIELNANTAELAKANVAGTSVRIRTGDALDADYSDATVVFAYLYPELLEKIIDKLSPGCKVVSYCHRTGNLDWQETTIAGERFYVGVKPSETVLDVEPLRNGKYAFIVVEATDQEFFEWIHRTEIEEKGWAVVRQPRRVRLASIVVIGKRVFPVRGYVTNQVLRECVAKTITAKPKPTASGLKITMISRANCSWCDKWMKGEYPKAIAAGVQVEFQTSNTGSVPRFEVCGADGQCRLFTGFTSFEKMER